MVFWLQEREALSSHLNEERDLRKSKGRKQSVSRLHGNWNQGLEHQRHHYTLTLWTLLLNPFHLCAHLTRRLQIPALTHYLSDLGPTTNQTGFPDNFSGKESAANAGDIRSAGLIPGLGRSPGEGHGNMATPVFLPEECTWTKEPGGLQSMGSQRVTRTHQPEHFRKS